MTYFKLDIPKVNYSVSRYKEIKNNCLDDVNIVYRGLGYTESAWRDPNAYTFIEKTKREGYKLNEYFDYLDNLYNEINQFKSNIDDICHRQGCRRNSIVLKFDDNQIDDCKKYLNNAISLLNSSLTKINIKSFQPDFQYLSLIYKLRSEINSLKSLINDLIYDINSFTNSINVGIYDSKFRMKRIGKFNLNIPITEYKWKTTSINTNIKMKKDFEEYLNVNSAAIQVDIKGNSNLSDDMNLYSSKTNNINLEESEKLEGLNKDLYTNFGAQNNINLEESEKLEGLNKDLYTDFGAQNDINLTKSGKIDGLDNNLEQKSVIENTVGFKSYKNEGNLSSNIVESKVDNASIDYKVNNHTSNLENIRKYDAVSQNNINMSGITTNSYNLNSGIEKAEVTSNNFYSNISSNINLNTDIKKMESLDELNK